MKKVYRPNVAAFVLDNVGQILVCERSDVRGAWQLPQGGIEQEESAQDALFRELSEEIGTSEIDIIAKLPHTITYDWPERLFKKGFHGQEQHFYLTRLLPGATPDLDSAEDEFADFKWVDTKEFTSLVQGFKREAYLSALEYFQAEFPGVLKCS